MCPLYFPPHTQCIHPFPLSSSWPKLVCQEQYQISLSSSLLLQVKEEGAATVTIAVSEERDRKTVNELVSLNSVAC